VLSKDPRVLSRDECVSIVQRIEKLVRGGGKTSVIIMSWWNGELRWARNRVSLATDRRDLMVLLDRNINGSRGVAMTNQIDDISLEAAIRSAERQVLRRPNPIPRDIPIDLPLAEYPLPTIWSDDTFSGTAEERGKLAKMLTEKAEAKEMLSAGYLEMRGASVALAQEGGDTQEGLSSRPRSQQKEPLESWLDYVSLTQAQCSMTVRHPKGTGSGWAGLSGYDWKTIDGVALAERALEKCLLSTNPVRIEPGRYTVVLEPQAVADLVDLLFPRDIHGPFDRVSAERGAGPFVLGLDQSLELVRTKLGLQVMDSRITISHNPMDPRLGVVPELGLKPITWIENGVLKTLHYDRRYALPVLNESMGSDDRPSYYMSGGTTTIEEMIASTKRGLLVSRFSNLRVIDGGSVLATGVTRDGLWLIEGGKISKAVYNMRITESPLFILNQVEQLGVPVPVFRPEKSAIMVRLCPAVVPPIKANDFSFTATIDAV
jgi:predicted Zn-dependent protease